MVKRLRKGPAGARAGLSQLDLIQGGDDVKDSCIELYLTN